MGIYEERTFFWGGEWHGKVLSFSSTERERAKAKDEIPGAGGTIGFFFPLEALQGEGVAPSDKTQKVYIVPHTRSSTVLLLFWISPLFIFGWNKEKEAHSIERPCYSISNNEHFFLFITKYHCISPGWSYDVGS